MKKLPNIHPGEILNEEFLEPLRISQNRIARDLGVPPRRINEIVLGKRAISSETGLLLDKYFGLSEGFFSRLQSRYDNEEAKDRLAKRLANLVPLKIPHLETRM